MATELVISRILIFRGKRVMLDRDLAELYNVPTKALNQAVKRNLKRFPLDFMFQLSKTEKNRLVTICDRFNSLKHSVTGPCVFTEQGVAMLSSVLNSERAIQVNIQIMRAFTQLRRIILSNQDLKRKIEEMEKKYDKQFSIVFEAIKQLLVQPKEENKKKIGFHA